EAPKNIRVPNLVGTRTIRIVNIRNSTQSLCFRRNVVLNRIVGRFSKCQVDLDLLLPGSSTSNRSYTFSEIGIFKALFCFPHIFHKAVTPKCRGSNPGTATGYALLMSSNKSETRIQCFPLRFVVKLDTGRLVQLQWRDSVLRKVAATFLDGKSIENGEEDKELEMLLIDFDRLSLSEAGANSWNSTDSNVVLRVISRALRWKLLVNFHEMAHTDCTKIYSLLRQRVN
ncbi:hypothetical protein CLF_104362, partial [Clonorchis sinensis]